MTTVETRVVAPVQRRTPVNTVNVSETKMVDAALKGPEERGILVDEDEEIDSCEAVDIEDHMLTVALVNSVVDSGAPMAQDADGQNSARYGLRKRRRPGEPAESGTTLGSRHHGNVVSSGQRRAATATITNGRLTIVTPEGIVGDRSSVPTLSQPPSAPGNTSNIAPGGRQSSVLNMKSKTQTGGRIKKLIETVGRPIEHPGRRVGNPSRQLPPLKPLSGASRAASTIPRATASKIKKSSVSRQKSWHPASAAISNFGSSTSTMAHSGDLAPTSGAVPNPLLQSTPPQVSHSYQQFSNSTSSTIPPYAAQAPAPSVPCPLPSSVPCPLPAEAPPSLSDKRVTISEPVVPTSRSRIFSVDLDPATFDFSDMAGDHTDIDKTDLTGIAPPSDDLTLFRRDRAFSFEFFSFGGDDLLPAPPAQSALSTQLPDPPAMEDHMTTRPRGDSIIFDPSSFQDGGIHEKNAIMKVNAAKKIDAHTPNLLADSRLAAPPLPAVPAPMHTSKPRVGPPAPVAQTHAEPALSAPGTVGADNGQLATLPSSLSVGNANGSTPATFQMELLNKDGRIGIYLPEARKARIARFHAKRKMRIWRKRIKYDCRKKLADSRPRIKGRFVKRSDMDD